MFTQCNQGHGSEPITTQAHMLQILPCYNMFILFIADSMGVSESLEGRYLQNLCQVIKSSVCPQKDRIIGAEIVSLRTMPHWFSFFAGECSLLLPTVSHLTASIGFQWSFQALGCLCGSSWHHMLCLCCAGFYNVWRTDMWCDVVSDGLIQESSPLLVQLVIKKSSSRGYICHRQMDWSLW